MIDINSWTDMFITALERDFADRLWFVGLQGSYGRGEATDSSDIDMVVILDELSSDDIKKYNDMLDTLPHRDKICGFLSGKRDLFNWEPSDLFQFYFDTTAIIGSLDELLSLIDGTAVDRAIKIGACNIYHGCVHNMLYEKSEDVLKSLYKSASFVIQTIKYKETGKYVRHLSELIKAVLPEEAKILDTFIVLKKDAIVDFNLASSALFEWCKKLI